MKRMSLPIINLRKRLQELIRNNKRGYMTRLAESAGVPDGTVHRIAYGKQKTVTYKIWKSLYDAEPNLPAPTFLNNDEDNNPKVGNTNELQRFIAALQYYYSKDERFNTADDLAMSVGLKESEAESLLAGDDSYTPTNQQKQVIAHAFGLSFDDFISAGQNVLEINKNADRDLEVSLDFDFSKATTTNPAIVQIVKMAEQLDEKKINILKENALKLLIKHIKDKYAV
jgi:hypothetical protein